MLKGMGPTNKLFLEKVKVTTGLTYNKPLIDHKDKKEVSEFVD